MARPMQGNGERRWAEHMLREAGQASGVAYWVKFRKQHHTLTFGRSQIHSRSVQEDSILHLSQNAGPCLYFDASPNSSNVTIFCRLLPCSHFWEKSRSILDQCKKIQYCTFHKMQDLVCILMHLQIATMSQSSAACSPFITWIWLEFKSIEDKVSLNQPNNCNLGPHNMRHCANIAATLMSGSWLSNPEAIVMVVGSAYAHWVVISCYCRNALPRCNNYSYWRVARLFTGSIRHIDCVTCCKSILMSTTRFHKLLP